MLSVDDAVNKIVSKVEKLGMIDETYFIFTSDHGYHIGQFGMVKVNIQDYKTPYFYKQKMNHEKSDQSSYPFSGQINAI